MQAQQLSAAIAELAKVVDHVVAVKDQHTPDVEIAPAVQILTQLTEKLRTAFPQA